MRAVAVALVILVHANVPGFPGGFVGVDVFFVLSGYLITGLLLGEHTATGRIGYLAFLARRLKRLLPALLTVLLAVALAAPLLLSAYEIRMQTGSILFAATWTSNFFFALAEFDYFAALKARDLFLHTWSLGIEEQFYVVWPWLIVAATLIAKFPRTRASSRSVMLALLLTTFVASLALSLYWAATAPLLGFYMMPARGWQFALGALVFVTLQWRGQDSAVAGDDSPGLVARLAGMSGLGLIVGSAVMLHDELTYPGYFALFPSVGAAAVILAGVRTPLTGLNSLLAIRPLVWLGDRSYSLYLWHWPVLLLGDAYGLPTTAFGTILLVALSVALSDLSYRYVELPFWKGRFSAPRPLPTIAVSLLAMTVTAGAVYAFHERIVGVPAVAANNATYDPRMDAPAIYTAGFNCDTGHLDAELEPCGVGATDAKHTAVLISDSIGAQWVSALPEIFTSPDWQVVVFTKSSCGIIDHDIYYEKIGKMYDVCAKWRNAALDRIASMAPDIVFVGSSANYVFTESQWVGGTQRILSRLVAGAQQVVVIPGTPSLSFDGPSCIEQPYRFSFRLNDSRRECEEGMTRQQSTDVAQLLATAVAGFDNVYLLDLNDLVCPESRCAAQNRDGLTVFRDHQHLTDSFVLQQVPEIRRRLDAARLGPDFFRDSSAATR